MKKIASFLLVLMMVSVVALGGCTANTPTEEAPASEAPATEEPVADATAEETPAEEPAEPLKVGATLSVPDPANAGGWDRAHYAGLNYLKDEYGWEVSLAEDVPYSKTSEVAVSYLDMGYDMIIFPDNGMIESWKELPAQYPDNWMVMVAAADALPEGSEKTCAFCPDFYQYGVMVGIAAAVNSESGVIGLLGGSPIPVLNTMFSGIIEGAKSVNPDSKCVVYWAGDWVDTAKHKEITNLMINDGADTIFTVTGPAAKGVYEAAETGGAKVIGYAWDLYDDNPNAIMVSLMLDTVKIYSMLADMYNSGTLENKLYDLGSEYCTFSDFRGSISAEDEAKINEIVEQYRAGTYEVPVVIHDEIMG